MTRDGILKIARECGIPEFENNESQAHNILTFFARIQQHLSYDGIHTCNDECQRPACVAVRKAVEREREACALAVEQAGIDGYGTLAAAAMIRARGNK
jgi:hypothetical protein